MKKMKFGIQEVFSFLECKILHNEADSDEMELYEDYKWRNVDSKELIKLNDYRYTYKGLLVEMKSEYLGK